MGEHTPGPWKADPHTGTIVYAVDNQMRIADVRGWGYLTGKGSGALGLPVDEALSIRRANAALIASAPDLKAENERLKAALERLSRNVRGLMVLETELRGIAGNTNVNALQEVLSAARNALGEKSDG